MTATDRPARRGELWTIEDYALLFDALVRGLDDDEVAEFCERTPTAVRKRVHWLFDGAYSEKEALRALRKMAVAPDFEWEEFVRAAHQRDGKPLWDGAADGVLIRGWRAAQPPAMAELTEQLGAIEFDIAKRCIRLGLAEHLGEVVDRFGAAPGERLEVLAKLARAAVPVGILTVTAEDGSVVHQSLHTSLRAALAALPTLTITGTAEPAVWTATLCGVGEGSTRRLRTGAWGEWPDALAAEQDLEPAAEPVRRGWRRLLGRDT